MAPLPSLLLQLSRRQDENGDKNNQDPPNTNDGDDDDDGGLSGWAIFIIIVVIFLALAAAGWFVWTYLRKRNAAPNFPAPRPGGIVGWFNDKLQNLKNRRTAAGAYEGTGGGFGGRRGAPLDPDEAWDTRVGNEADVYGPGGYYEEQELGLHPPTAYSGTGYGQPSPGFGPAADDDRGRSRSRQRELDERYDAETGNGRNPFGDDAEQSSMSMRGVSPRPIDTSAGREPGGHSDGNSPTERRSMFREAV